MSRHDGGPAFPRQMKEMDGLNAFDQEFLAAQQGMSLRDYFAGQAIKGWLASCAQGSYSYVLAHKAEIVDVGMVIADEYLRRRKEPS